MYMYFTDNCFLFKLITSNRLNDNYNKLLVRNSIVLCTSFLKYFITFVQEIKILKEDNNRVSAQLLQHGKVLVNQKPKSLAQELQDAPRGDVSYMLCILQIRFIRLVLALFSSIIYTLSSLY